MANENQLKSTDTATASSLSYVSNENENNALENESRWWEIENDDFILDQVPNVTSEFLRQPQPRTDSESEITENFERLHKIADKIKLTLSEHAKNNNEKPEDSQDLETSLAEVHTYHEQSLAEFKEELRVRRLARQSAVQELRDEITSLRQQLAAERARSQPLSSTENLDNMHVLPQKGDFAKNIINPISSQEHSLSEEAQSHSNDADDEDPLSRSRHANIELANAQLALQMANSENISLRGELSVVQKQVATLKEVITCCKQMLTIKEEQCNELKQKLSEIEKSFAEHEMKLMSDNLRQEYERQLANIRQLRQLYEERQRISAAEYENLQRLISIKRDELSNEQEKTKKLEEGNQKLVNDLENVNNELECLRDECKEHKFEKATLKEEIGAVNMLFSQMVLGFNGKNNLDIDRLTAMLEENRALLNELAVKELNCSDDATLPKLLFELVEQASVSNDNNQQNNSSCHNSNSITPEVEDVNVDWNNISNTNDNAALLCADGNNGNYTQAQQQQSVGERGAMALPKNYSDDKVIVFGSISTANTVKSGKKLHRKNSNKKATAASTTVSLPTSSSTAALLNLHDSPNLVNKFATAEEIIGNLPKVWKVLMELLSHHHIEQVQFDENGKGEDCYKSDETANNNKAELSVSKTYLKLKDLILEKKSLVKETNRLKTLNCHLECRLNEQEKRLSTVSLELTKTWHLVGKMQRQHRQLHTQEQILRYQLQQKRRLLSELKDELEYCRRKWAAARAKNDESQEQCNDLRREFAKRKLEDSNNSAESGYSDSCGPASEEEYHEHLPIIESSKNVLEVASACANYRRKRLREMFEHTRKIKRMQSNSPGRAAGNVSSDHVVVLRWNSAPPTCGWRDSCYGGDEVDDEENVTSDLPAALLSTVRNSRSPKRHTEEKEVVNKKVNENSADLDDEPQEERAVRIKRLEEQCKSLIQQVLETSDNRERLEIQLRHFQDEMAPVKYPLPIQDENIKRHFERMTRASSAPATGCLTPREEEYTRKRSERLGRLEEESRQLISRIRRTADRGNYLRRSLERLRRVASPEGSFESNTEEEQEGKTAEQKVSIAEKATDETGQNSNNPTKCFTSDSCEERNEVIRANRTTDAKDSPQSSLTEDEEAYTARRSARLQRLEDESRQLLDKLSRNTQRGDKLGNRLDTLHQRYGNSEAEVAENIESGPPLNERRDTPAILTVEERINNIEKISLNREERLLILEEEGRQLINRLSETSERGTKMITRIAERESNREKRSSSHRDNNEGDTSNSSITEDNPTAVAIWPTPKNVACSSIVSEELTERVTITTIPSQMVASQGAIPKSKPAAQLYAALPKSARIHRGKKETEESLEDMVKRLKSLPFPTQNSNIEENVKFERQSKKENENEDNNK